MTSYFNHQGKDMPELESWREWLAQNIENTQERQRIATELGINPLTLMRWAHGQSNPRPQHLRRLLEIFPEQRQLLITLIQQEFPDFSAPPAENSLTNESSTIPVEFYTRVLHTLATLPKELYFWSLGDLILQEALQQLDPHRLGMAIMIAQCMPPLHGHIRSLREVMGRGTPPWESSLEQQLAFLGAESLAGYAVISAHLVTNQNLRKSSGRASGYASGWEESAAAAPIMHAGEIAGCLLVSSTQPDYFLPHRCTLIENYAELFALVVEPGEFYKTEQIALGLVPSAEEQRPYFSGFRQRVLQKMTEARGNQHIITPIQAEMLVWQEIEGELLQRPYQSE